jgi:hypothetical protein
MNNQIYQIKKAERLDSGLVKHEVIMPWGEDSKYLYRSIRIGMSWPTTETPAFFVVAGMEIEDQYAAFDNNLVRVIDFQEIPDLSLNNLFNAISDSYTSMMADCIYFDFKVEDYKQRFWEYLDKTNLRGITSQDIPYKDVVLRLSTIKDFNDSGSLVIDKGSVLFQDLQGISRSHLKEKPEEAFYRLNGLGYLIAGFSKFPPLRKIRMSKNFKYGEWQF